MNRILFILLAYIVIGTGCGQDKPSETKTLETSGIGSQGPYLTKDHNGNAVLCWTEQGADSLNRLKYAVYDQDAGAFGPAVTVAPSGGCSAAAESMGKVAFKEDGTAVAIFVRRFSKEKNPFAGAIYYSVSVDSGKTWSDAAFLHSDTTHAYGRSFFDVERLQDGELAAIWLDGRYAKSIKGSALFFSRTTKGAGFAADTCLDKGTCECCRTDLLKDAAGNLHIAYRSILFPEPLSGKQVRDMVYTFSSDNGHSFSKPRLISNDNWEIEGCPHSGPSLAVQGSTTHAVWFTAAGGNAGLYNSNTNDGTKGFGNRTLLTNTGRHPQMAALSGDRTAIVYEETAKPAGHGSMHHAPAETAKIILRFSKDGNEHKIIEISDGHEPDNHAVLMPVGDDVLLAWVREGKSGSKICYTKVKL